LPINIYEASILMSLLDKKQKFDIFQLFKSQIM